MVLKSVGGLANNEPPKPQKGENEQAHRAQINSVIIDTLKDGKLDDAERAYLKQALGNKDLGEYLKGQNLEQVVDGLKASGLDNNAIEESLAKIKGNTTDKIKQAERCKSGENVNEEAIKYESDIKPAENVNQDARLESAAKLDSRPEGSFGV